jgi:hypothetical protein
MKKELSIAIAIMLLCQIAGAQTVTPNTSTQFCPNQETEFTVTLSKAYSSLEALNGSIITESPYNVSQDKKSFKFKGKFTDVNKKQTFRINYADGSNPKDFDFLNIQSWFFYDASVDCIKIQPNLSIINAPVCQNAAISLSFGAIKWYTAYTNPVNCFGSIANYEYKLPANWKIGSSTSTGNNWISGGASVSIIPDLNTGNTQYVYVRPATCGAGLANNYVPVAIPVARGSAFTINSNTSSFVCGATPTVGLSINSSGVTGITDYSWNF